MLRNDGTVVGWDGISNVVAVSAGLALRSDGTVVGLGATVPAGLTNVTAISGVVGNGLIITTNPPPPILSGAASGTSFVLTTPLSVPGYALEAANNQGGPFSIVDSYTNATTTTNLVLPISGQQRFYRLHKQ
jgi:hypothetical protein